ncbi:MAG: sodium-dependent transporter [Bifidobacteriaceae bacterium]|jgi:NSS family neurotransmitter:Na+ symporter|nr:sodium-dependent transporter [Bifidobacteriaceae bacterium]
MSPPTFRQNPSRANTEAKAPKDNAFSSAYGFIITTIGFAVGVGTIWRFPYLLGENGGSLYLITYIGIIALICVPLLAAEMAIGFKGQASAVKSYQALEPPRRPWHLAGWLHLATALLVIGYVVPVFGWILKYLIATPLGDFNGLDATGTETYFNDFISRPWEVLIFALVNLAINAAVVLSGVKRGVELLSKILLPVLGVVMVGLIVFGLTLDGAGEGIAFLLKPDPSKYSLATVQSALGQAFFAVGIAMLASMIFGSYIKNPKEKLARASTLVSTSIVVAGLLAGFMIFPVLFSAGIAPTSGAGLVFMTLPNAFNQIPLGAVFGTLFYLGFYFAALTSMAGIIEACVGMFMDQFKLKRPAALAVTIGIMTAIGAVCTFAFDPVFDVIDLAINNYLLPLGALIIAIFVGWVWGVDKFIAACHVKSEFSKLWLKLTVKYLCPVAVLVIFLGSFF